jgi:hypothetical protein
MSDSQITRVEVIDETGRQYVRHDAHVELSLQDNGKTLKIFVQERGDNA